MMKNLSLLSLVILLVLLNSSFIHFANASTEVWSKTFGGSSGERAYSLVETLDGGYALAGFTHSFGDGGHDFWLVKIDSEENMKWNQTYGGPLDDRAYSMVITSDGGFALAGTTYSFGDGSGDFWLVKTDAEGNVEWNQTYEAGAYDCANSLIQSSDGGYVMGGHSSFILQKSWIVKTDSAGAIQWNKTYGGGEVRSLIETADGKFAFILGSQLFKIDNLGNVEWSKTFDGGGYSLIQTSDEGFAVTGVETIESTNLDFWLIKMDDFGNLSWSKTYGGSSTDHAYSLVETSDEGYALAGETYSFDVGHGDVWLLKTDFEGNMLWNQTYGGTGYEGCFSLIEVSAGGFALAGKTDSLGSGSVDFYFMKTDAHGIIPEFPSWTILPLLIVATLVGVIVRNKLRKKGL